MYDSSAGIIISKNALTTGSDLSNHSLTLTPGDESNGPDFTLVNHADLALATGENIVGVRRTIRGYNNTGFELIILEP